MVAQVVAIYELRARAGAVPPRVRRWLALPAATRTVGCVQVPRRHTVTTQDDEQAREDWEGLGERERRLLNAMARLRTMHCGQGWAAAAKDLRTRGLITSNGRRWWLLTEQGRRCAAYGRKVTGG